MPQPASRWVTAGLLVLSVALVFIGVAADRGGPTDAPASATPDGPPTDVAPAIPSTLAVPESEVDQGLPIVSLAVDDAALFDPVTGIHANPLGRGRRWEREGFVSYFDAGRLRLASGVGVRIHGDSSRTHTNRQSYRLYFRNTLGTDRFGEDLVFGGAADPVRVVVLHNDRRPQLWTRHPRTNWSLVNPLAYAIARRIGATAPLTQPVRLFMNGEDRGVYVITEYVGNDPTNNPDYYRVHFGHDGIWGPLDPRTKLDQASPRQPMDQLGRWIGALGRPLLGEDVAERVGLDSLTRWFLAVLFCATGDAIQLPGPFYDSTRDRGQWFWINWDMDQSFWDWDVDSFHVVLESQLPGGGLSDRVLGMNDPRPYLISTLLADDEAYRRRFMIAFAQMLNHQLTTEFLEAQFTHYAEIARDYGVQDLRYLEYVRQFLIRRPDTLWTHAVRYLGTGDPVRLSVYPPAGGLLVDGALVTQPYEGRYFPGMAVEITMPEGTDATLSHWVFDGRRVETETPQLRLRLEADIRIEAVAG